MLIEQTIEFKLRRPGPPSRTCTPKPKKSYFDKKNLQSIYLSDYLLLKILHEECTLLLPPGPSHQQN